MRTIWLIAILVVLTPPAVVLAARWRWRHRTDGLVSQLGGRAAGPTRFSPEELAGLPAPAARYLSAVLRDGQPMVRRARLEQEGQFLLKPPDGWAPFTAVQHLDPTGPGFVWDARIRMMPGVAVLVRDGLVDGVGSMRASALGLIPVVTQEGTPAIAQGALYRFLAEAVWCPTALLPSQGVRWEAVDDTTARASLSAGATTVSLEFRFGPDSLVVSVYAPDRARDVHGVGVPTPWQGRWFEWGERDGMRVPLRGEVEWILPDGPHPYWRGRVTAIAFEPGGR
jgi:hypothetical protein